MVNVSRRHVAAVVGFGVAAVWLGVGASAAACCVLVGAAFYTGATWLESRGGAVSRWRRTRRRPARREASRRRPHADPRRRPAQPAASAVRHEQPAPDAGPAVYDHGSGAESEEAPAFVSGSYGW